MSDDPVGAAVYRGPHGHARRSGPNRPAVPRERAPELASPAMHLCAARTAASRRAFLGLLGVGAAAVLTGLAGCAGAEPPGPPPPPPLPPVPEPRPGPSRLMERGPADTGQRIALTVDDGTCVDCVAGYVEFARRTGTHLTFSPNGVLDGAWRPQAKALAPLIATGQVQMINHTWSHPRLSTLPEAKIREEIERNDEWVVKVFGVTTRPYCRPPFGERDATVDAIAGSLGYTRSVQWSGSYNDSGPGTPEALMEQARKIFRPGGIVLGHANQPTVLGLFDELLALLRERRLEAVTLDEMFGTSRAVG